jgi:hypothetical protein
MRKMLSPLHRAAGTAALALVLVSGGLAASTAFAQQADLNGLYHTGQNNDFGARQDASVLRAAKAAPSTVQLTAEQRKTLNDEFRVGQNNDFGAGRGSASALSSREYHSRIASTVTTIGTVGDGSTTESRQRDSGYFPTAGAPLYAPTSNVR